MNIGISSYAYAWSVGTPGRLPDLPLTAFGLIDKAVRLSVNYVQLCDNIALDCFTKHDLEELFQYALQNNVHIEVGALGLTAARLEQYIEIARVLKSKILRFVIDKGNYTPSIPQTAGIIKDFTAVLEKEGIYLAIENHDRLQSRDYLKLLHKTQSNFVRICLDTVNSLGAGEGIATVLNELGPWTVNLHVKEYAIRRVENKMGFLVEGKPLGKGQLPLPDVLKKISPLCKTAVLEQWVPFTGKLETTIQKEEDWASESINHLKKIMSQSPVVLMSQ
ncbi:xylose isomerase domain-containing protein [Flammeovirgaceae bacterium 311]|nr:xylose isomerase domain-containing protein [Flammeovirgaceae bacterium 311]